MAFNKEVAKIPVVAKEKALTLAAVDTYPDHCRVSESAVVGVDKTCTNFGNTGLDDCAKVAVDVRCVKNTLTRTGANLGLSEKDTSVKHGVFMFDVSRESVSHYVGSSEKPDPYDTATLTKLLDALITALVHRKTVITRDHLSYSGAIEVGMCCTGSTKLVVGTGLSPTDGTGDITCALSIVDFPEEALVGPDTPKVADTKKDRF